MVTLKFYQKIKGNDNSNSAQILPENISENISKLILWDWQYFYSKIRQRPHTKKEIVDQHPLWM